MKKVNVGSRRMAAILSFVTLIAANRNPVATASSFVPLGDIPGGGTSSEALGVDATGSIVVGSSATSGGSDAFVWTQSSGISGIGVLGYAAAVSSDTQTVVGAFFNASGVTEPFRWTSSGGVQPLGVPPGEALDMPTNASDVSGNGELVVGTTVFGAKAQAYRWTSRAGFVGLGDLFGGQGTSAAAATSVDGQVVVGQTNLGAVSKAFVWSSGTGMLDLGDLPGGNISAGATNVSADGAVVVGSSASSTGMEAFRWTGGSGMVGLGFLPGFGTQSIATASTELGRAVVGISGIPGSVSGTKAFVWTSTAGMQPLDVVLATKHGLGVAIAGWNLTAALDMTADGRFIVGRGINPQGDTEAWLVRLDRPVSVPEPTEMVVPCALLVAFLIRKKG